MSRMSADEWLQAFFMAATQDGKTIVYDKEITIDEIKSSLRKAVIREASAGVVTFDSAFLEPIYDDTLGLDGDYDLIPKEVSK